MQNFFSMLSGLQMQIGKHNRWSQAPRSSLYKRAESDSQLVSPRRRRHLVFMNSHGSAEEKDLGKHKRSLDEDSGRWKPQSLVRQLQSL